MKNKKKKIKERNQKIWKTIMKRGIVENSELYYIEHKNTSTLPHSKLCILSLRY
jgi:hypothetical protein